MKTDSNFSFRQFLRGECTHDQYYGQFIDPVVLIHIMLHFQLIEIKECLNHDDYFLKSIPQKCWDNFSTKLELVLLNRLGTMEMTATDYISIAKLACRILAGKVKESDLNIWLRINKEITTITLYQFLMENVQADPTQITDNDIHKLRTMKIGESFYIGTCLIEISAG